MSLLAVKRSPAMPDGMQALGGLRIRLSDHGRRLVCRYGKVTLSIHPQTHTEDMHSWFPIFFPLKEPIHCPAGAAIQAHMWRCSANHKVGRPASLLSMLTSLVMQLYVLLICFTYVDVQQGPDATVHMGPSGWLSIGSA